MKCEPLSVTALGDARTLTRLSCLEHFQVPVYKNRKQVDC